MRTGVTTHGKNRGKQRLGIPRQSVERMAAKALAEGKGQADFSGKFRRYLDKLGATHKNKLLVYGNHIYVFGGDVLVTVLNIPTEYRGVK